MKRSIPYLILYGIVAALLLFALGACSGPGQGPAAQVQAFLDVALADHVLSGDELKQLVALIDKLADAEPSQIDWPTFLGGLAGTAVSSVLGVNLYRNKTRARALESVQASAVVQAGA